MVIEIEDYMGNTLMAIELNKKIGLENIERLQGCAVADFDEDYIFNSNKTLIRLQQEDE